MITQLYFPGTLNFVCDLHPGDPLLTALGIGCDAWRSGSADLGPILGPLNAGQRKALLQILLNCALGIQCEWPALDWVYSEIRMLW